jgi:DNA repair protein RadC
LCFRYKTEIPKKRQPLTIKATYAGFWKLLDGIYQHETREVVDVYLLDSNSEIFSCQRLAEGDISSVEFTANALAKIIIDTPPAGLFIVHNHPQGTTQPSKADRQVTKKCQLLCSLHNIMFCDHIIYANGQIYSYYESGKMQPISVKFAAKKVLDEEEEE